MKKIIITLFALFNSLLSAELTTVTNNYTTEVAHYQKEKEEDKKQFHFDKMKEYAEILLGFVPGVKLHTYDKIKNFCALLEDKIPELQKLCDAEDKKVAIRAKRTTSNYAEIGKFLKACSRLIDTIYQSPQIIDLILQKCPEEVPYIAYEIVVILKILEMVIASPEDIEAKMTLMMDFASSLEDGTWLLSSLLSLVMKDPENANFEEILSSTDFSNSDMRIYLKIW
ncbi:MAG: hypothetical protein LBB34_03190 [Holosporales bacterium]|jgi:hypothetical protein|nr:hypothetical protein [Holosporales bacterium]